ncbi:MAG: GNAT family N-acetyltransferase [Phycisphaerales bacterium]
MHARDSHPATLPILLRPTLAADLPVLFQHQLDPESNRMAVTNPRGPEAFAESMTKALADPRVVARVIVAQSVHAIEGEHDVVAGRDARSVAPFPDPRLSAIPPGTILGSINCFQMDGLDAVGYWIAREHWGLGIASRALALFFAEVTRRPLHARAALTNAASIRVLRKGGFRITGTFFGAATDRYPACEVVSLILD